MKSFVTWMDNCPLWLKIVFALPCLDIVWGIYRLIKGIAYNKASTLIGGVIWIILGWGFLWIIDIFSIIFCKNPNVLA